MLLQDSGLGDPCSQILCAPSRSARSAADKQNQKFFATQSENRTLTRNLLLEQSGDFTKDDVPRVVTKAIIDALEVIEIDRQQRSGNQFFPKPIDSCL